MNEKQFVANFADLFDDTDPSEITIDRAFRDMEEWSSLLALSVMAMCAEEYNVILSANEMENSHMVRDVYEIVKSRC